MKHTVRFQQQQKAVSYHIALWILFISCTIWAVVDRLTVNMWSLGVAHTFPHDAVWGVQVFEVFSWISGRISIVTTSVLFLTQCRTSMNILVDYCPKWMYIGDIHRINNTVHKIAGWITGIVVLAHVWLIFLGPVTSGTKIIFLDSQSMRSQVPFYDAETETLALAPDDVWRLIEMTVIFLILIPLSMWAKIKMCRKTRYSTAMIIHLIAGLMFAYDIIRKKSHPHSKVFNIPIVAYWGFDRVAGMIFYRKTKAKVTRYFDFDDGRYLVLFLQFEKTKGRKEGEVLYLQFQKETRKAALEYSHPFTMWSNRGMLTGIEDEENMPKISCYGREPGEGGKVVYEWSKAITGIHNTDQTRPTYDDDDIDTDYISLDINHRATSYPIPSYDYACIVKVIEHQDKSKKTWTQQLLNKLNEPKTISNTMHTTLDCFGPYHTLFHNLRTSASMLPAMVFIGSGAGASPLIDFHQYLTHNEIRLERPVIMLYTCNSPELFQFVASILMSHHMENFTCKGWITQYKSDVITQVHEYAAAPTIGRNSTMRGSRRIEDMNCRVSLQEELSKAKELSCTDVFFCGNPTIEKEIQKHCKTIGLAMNLGHTVG